MSAPRVGPRVVSEKRLAALLVLVFILLAGSAMLRTSTTFDEIVFPAVGARALHTGDFSMVNDHPRLAQVLYGLPLYLSGVRYPPEDIQQWNWVTRYHYSQYLYWAAGNSGEKVTALARLVGLTFGALIVLATFLFSRRHMPDAAALLAATLIAFLPDMLAHSGIAYNDIPLAFGVLVSVYAADAAIRRPSWRSAALAGLAVGFTICVKYSGLILFPILFVLVSLEALARRHDADWRVALTRAAAVFAAVIYAILVALYGGDWRLREYAYGLGEISFSIFGEQREAFLLGDSRIGGWWYFYPVALALKTPAGLHVLALAAAVAGVAAARGLSWRTCLSHPARAPAAAFLLLLAATLTSRMNIGVRHALPVVLFGCILVAQGIAWAWARHSKAYRAFVAVSVAALAVSTLSAYPYFISYVSEYAYRRPLYATLVDSNTDWGQGLVALREYMRENGIERVSLGYFGSALPNGYGISYVQMPSNYQLPNGAPPGTPRPRYAVVSATLLAGVYMFGDPYALLREEKPVAIVGGSLYVFDTQSFRHR